MNCVAFDKPRIGLKNKNMGGGSSSSSEREKFERDDVRTVRHGFEIVVTVTHGNYIGLWNGRFLPKRYVPYWPQFIPEEFVVDALPFDVKWENNMDNDNNFLCLATEKTDSLVHYNMSMPVMFAMQSIYL